MRTVQRILLGTAAIVVLAAGVACAPAPGTEAWCNKMKEKPKGEWTANEAADYAKHCVLGN
ncbi:MAG: DUF3012 domain-containing protein, partial [Nitrospirota bacterium]|nr:DUF3012 domain-containing protein [Nitrospirota bacterium]